MSVELIDSLIAPITPEHPSGEDISWEAEYDEIREARRADDPNLSQGDWQTEIKSADWVAVRKQCERLLKERSKDLQLACWYVESLTYLDGFNGFAFGLNFMDKLLSTYWQQLHPSAADDMDARVSKLEWFNNNLMLPLKNIPVTGGHALPLTLIDWELCQAIEQQGAKDPEYRTNAVRDGKPTHEVFDKAMRQSGVPFYRQLNEQVKLCRERFLQLDHTINTLFGDNAPTMRELRQTIEQLVEFVNRCLREIGAYVEDADTDATPSSASANDTAASPTNVTLGTIQNRAQAVKQLRLIASWFRDNEPHSPVPLLCERAAQWADMPLEEWLRHVVHDDSAMLRLRDMLGFSQ